MATFGDDSQRVMKLAESEARRFNHEYIGTEHLLLALAKDRSGFTTDVLKNLDLDPARIPFEVEAIVQFGPAPSSRGRLPYTPFAKRAVEHAIDEARKLNHQRVDVPHVLLGLIRVTEGVAAHVLVNLGVTLEVVRSEVLRQLDEKTPG
jgi:ATP-dependent Clp protease ATP-binding subunit ClpC